MLLFSYIYLRGESFVQVFVHILAAVYIYIAVGFSVVDSNSLFLLLFIAFACAMKFGKQLECVILFGEIVAIVYLSELLV